MLDQGREGYVDLLKQTDNLLAQSRSEIAVLTASLEQAKVRAVASRIALNASREALRTIAPKPLRDLCGP